MKTRSSQKGTDEIIAEASAWFIEFRSGETSASVRASFHEWLRQSPQHIQAYLEIAEGWAELPTTDPQHRLDVPALLRRARASGADKVIPLPRNPAAGSYRRRLSFGPRVAVGLVSVVLLSALAVGMFLSAASVVRTGVGEQRTVRLADGTTLDLNAVSSVRVRFSAHAREIDLQQGQALFHVAKDPARPFIVRSFGTTIQAVGTEFDVYQKADRTVVTVVEGRVAVSQPAAMTPDSGAHLPHPELLLDAGDQVSVPQQQQRSHHELEARHADVAAATAWVQKQLIFDDTPLAEVAEEFNRYSTRRLVIVAPELRSLGVSGVYSSTDPDSILGFLRAQPNLRLSETDREIRVSDRAKK